MSNNQNNPQEVPQVKSVEDCRRDVAKIFGFKTFYDAIEYRTSTNIPHPLPKMIDKVNEMYASQFQSRISELKAENVKLREALEGVISLHESKSNIQPNLVHWESVAFGMFRKAQQALNIKEG